MNANSQFLLILVFALAVALSSCEECRECSAQVTIVVKSDGGVVKGTYSDYLGPETYCDGALDDLRENNEQTISRDIVGGTEERTIRYTCL